jgi:hypothetical protein
MIADNKDQPEVSLLFALAVIGQANYVYVQRPYSKLNRYLEMTGQIKGLMVIRL